MDFSIVLLTCYTIAWGITLYMHIKNSRRFDALSFFYATLVFYAFCSLLLYNDNNFSFKELTLFPFIYLYIFLYITSLPIKQLCTCNINSIILPSRGIIIAISIIPIICNIVSLPNTYTSLFNSFTNVFTDSSSTLDAYLNGRELTNSTGSGISNLSAIFANAFLCINTLMLFTVLMMPKRNRWLIIGISFSILMSILQSISAGERGGVFQVSICLFATFLATYSWLPKKIRRFIMYTGLAISLLILSVAIKMTINRFSDTAEGVENYTIYYLGQQNLYFNNYALNDNGIRYGDRTIPLFKRILGFSNVPNNYEQRRDKYKNLYINDEVFSSYIGDFTIDYGPTFAAILMIIITTWILKRTKPKDNRLYFHQLLMTHFIICMCMQGGLELFQFSDTSGNLQIIVYIIAYTIARLSREETIIAKY